MTHLCSPKSTHTKNTICPTFARGQERANARRRASFSFVTRSFFPDQFVSTWADPGGQAPGPSSCLRAKAPPHLCGGGLLLEQSRVISRECRSLNLFLVLTSR